jgi:hypothetical protein
MAERCPEIRKNSHGYYEAEKRGQCLRDAGHGAFSHCDWMPPLDSEQFKRGRGDISDEEAQRMWQRYQEQEAKPVGPDPNAELPY